MRTNRIRINLYFVIVEILCTESGTIVSEIDDKKGCIDEEMI